MMTTLAVFIFLFVIFYQRRTIRYQEAVQRLETEKQRALLKAVLETQESERHRLAEDLHDSVGQVVSAIRMNVNRLLHMQDERVAAEVQRTLMHDTQMLTQECISEIRHIIHNILPPLLVDFGLPEALRDLAGKVQARTGMLVDVELPTRPLRYPRQVEVMLYRVTQELINNALKHAGAGRVVLTLRLTTAGLWLSYADDGVGFEAGQQTQGFGLQNMESRVQLLNGSLRLTTAPRAGTRVEITVPAPPETTPAPPPA